MNFEAFPLKHSHCSKPEGPRSSFFRSRRVRLNYSPTVFLNRVQRGPQGNSSYTLFPEVSIYEKASETPEFPALIIGYVQLAVVAARIDPGQFFLGTVLAPSNCLVAGVDQDSVRTALIDQSPLFFSVQCDRILPLQAFLQQTTFRMVVERAPAPALNPVVFREELLEIRPSSGA